MAKRTIRDISLKEAKDGQGASEPSRVCSPCQHFLYFHIHNIQVIEFPPRKQWQHMGTIRGRSPAMMYALQKKRESEPHKYVKASDNEGN